MTLITKGVAAAAALLATAVAATAGTPAGVSADKAQVLVCERPTPAKHVLHHEHGRMEFVSARRLLADPKPSAKPRCITRAELARYQVMYAQRTQAVASR